MEGAMMSVRLPLFTAVLLAGGAWVTIAQEKTEPSPAAKHVSSPEAVQAMKDGVEAMRRHDWKAAAVAWQQAVKLEPANAGAWANLGRVQLQQQDAAGAIPSLEKAVALQPALVEAWVALGLACDRTGAPMRAISCLTRAAHEAPADAKVHNSLAIVLKNYGWTGAAESELQKALDLDPNYAEAHFNLALMFLEHRPPSLEMARRHYEAAREQGAERDKDVESRLAGPPPAAENVGAPAVAPKAAPPKSLSSKTTRPKP
jgi:Flp pilus assembly protein TadD